MKTTRTLGIAALALVAAACSSSKGGASGSGGMVGTGGAATTGGVIGSGGAASGGSGGGTAVGSCTDVPEYCVMYTTQAACQAIGCYWSNSTPIESCEGTGWPCSHFTTQATCAYAGCTWLAGVAPAGTGGAGTGGAPGTGGAGGGGTNGTGGTVGGPTTLATIAYPADIAVDATSVYFTNFAKGVSGAGTVVRCTLPDCPGGPAVLANNGNGPWGLTLDDTYLYWVEEGTSGENSTDGLVLRVKK